MPYKISWYSDCIQRRNPIVDIWDDGCKHVGIGANNLSQVC